MHSAGLELTKLTYAKLEDYLIRHRGDRLEVYHYLAKTLFVPHRQKRVRRFFFWCSVANHPFPY